MTIDEIFTNIANILINSINDIKWKRIQANFEAYKNIYIDVEGIFEKKDGTHDIDFNVDNMMALEKEIYALQEIMGESNKWNKAIFTVWANGKFDMQFSWDAKRDSERTNNLNEYAHRNT